MDSVMSCNCITLRHYMVPMQALLELWHAGVLKKFDEEKLLVKAEIAKL